MAEKRTKAEETEPKEAVMANEEATPTEEALAAEEETDELLFEVLHTNVAGHSQGAKVTLEQLGITPRRGSSITQEDCDRYLARLIDIGAVQELKGKTKGK